MNKEIRRNDEITTEKDFRQKAQEFSKVVWKAFNSNKKFEQTVEILCIYHEIKTQDKRMTCGAIAEMLSPRCNLTKRTAQQVITLCSERLWDYVDYNEDYFNNYKPIPSGKKTIGIIMYLHDYIEQL